MDEALGDPAQAGDDLRSVHTPSPDNPYHGARWGSTFMQFPQLHLGRRELSPIHRAYFYSHRSLFLNMMEENL